MTPRSRSILFWLALLAVLVGVLAFTGAFSFGQRAQPLTWASAHRRLADDARKADAAGNAGDAAEIRAGMVNVCRAAAALPPDGSSDEQAVRGLCSSVNANLPTPQP